jgi:SAM-dependent methyltransferase
VKADIDTQVRLADHGDALASKPELQRLFQDIHERFLDLERDLKGEQSGLRIELGSGVFPLSRSDRSVLSAEVVPGAEVDLLFDAHNMPFADTTVQTLFLQNVFHHFADPATFFREAQRVLVRGGLVIMLEPQDSLLGRALYPRLFNTETFDRKMVGWRAPTDGPMSGANQALSHIVFLRDRRIFEAGFPALPVVAQRSDPSWFRYLASGGLNFPRIAPRIAFQALRRFEHRLTPFQGLFGLHHYIVLRHEPDQATQRRAIG